MYIDILYTCINCKINSYNLVLLGKRCKKNYKIIKFNNIDTCIK